MTSLFTDSEKQNAGNEIRENLISGLNKTFLNLDFEGELKREKNVLTKIFGGRKNVKMTTHVRHLLFMSENAAE